jgi:hypothetical protein
MEIIDIIHNEYSFILENKKNINNLILNNIDINEQFDFGFPVESDGSVIIKNTVRIDSPISGKIKNSLSRSSSCKNALVVLDSDEQFYLEYCNISNVRISNNSKVSSGELLGKVLPGEDVKVTLYSKTGKKIKIDSREAKEIVGMVFTTKNIALLNNPDEYKKEKKQGGSPDPLMAKALSGLLKLPSYPFKNKYDKSGKMTQKRFGSPVDKKPVEKGWIFKALADPFGTKRKKEEEKNNVTEGKKLSEEIVRIKQLIR